MNAKSVTIHPEEIQVDFIRASGPGGQNVNKVATAVQLRFNVFNSQSLKPEVRQRLLRIAGKRVNAEGDLIIEARRFRQQQRNREDAVQRLLLLVEKASRPPKVRLKSHPTISSKIKRLNNKKKHAAIKKLRGQVSMEE